MTTKIWALLLVVICTLMTSSAQVVYKLGIKPFNPYLILLGLCIYGVAAVVLIVALKGGELSVLYPLIATSYIWVSLFSPIFFPSDSMNITKWIGIILIMLGVSCIGLGSRQKNMVEVKSKVTEAI